jgi:hypothetical protein
MMNAMSSGPAGRNRITLPTMVASRAPRVEIAGAAPASQGVRRTSRAQFVDGRHEPR